jgi:uncharacterized protein (TIGR04222 family)
LLEEVPAALLRVCQSGDGLAPGQLKHEIGFLAGRIRQGLEQAGLVVSSETRWLISLSSWGLFGAIVVMGSAKIYVGIERGKPVLFLLCMVVAAIVLGWLMARSRHRTLAGQHRLDESRRELQQFKKRLQSEPSWGMADAATSAALGVAVLGVASASQQSLLDPSAAQLLERSERAAQSWSTGCGSGCGGGGGGGGVGVGGGGDGGGGCGGCGGD